MENESDIDAKRRGIAELWRGYGISVCSKIFPQIRVLTLALGQSFGLFLTTDNKVFSFGWENNETPLGLGSHVRQTDVPTPLPFFQDKIAVDVACGPHQLAAICKDGSLFMWGKNDTGQCGQHCSDAVTIETPREVTITEHFHVCAVKESPVSLKVSVSQVACGECHTLAVASGGSLWAWGTGVQLGLPEVKGHTRPRNVPLPVGRHVVSVSCGAQHSLAILCESEALLAGKPMEDANLDLQSQCETCNQIREAVELGKGQLVVDSNCCPLGLPVPAASSSGLEFAVQHNSPTAIKIRLSKDKRTKDQENTAFGGGKKSSDTTLCEIQSNEQPLMIVGSPISYNVTGGGDIGTQSFAYASSDELDNGKCCCPALQLDHALNRCPDCNLTLSEPQSAVESFDNAASGQTACSSNSSDDDDRLPCDGPSLPNSWSLSLKDDTSDKSSTLPVGTCKIPNSDTWDQQDGYFSTQFVKKFLSQQILRSSATCISDGSATRSKLGIVERFSTLPSPIARNAVDTFHFVSKYDWDDEERQSINMKELELSIDGEEQSSVQNSISAQSLDVDSSGSVTLRRKKSSTRRPPVGSSCECIGGARDPLIRASPLSFYATPFADDAQKQSWQTEVWSWGRSVQGQTGVGDALNRIQPTCIKSLKNVGVVKVAAGHEHSVALLASGRVFVWGSNLHGQLSQQEEEPSYSPVPINLPLGTLVCDIAVGRKSSVFLVSRGSEQEIQLCGKQEGSIEKAENSKTSVLTTHKVGSKNCTIRQVFAGGVHGGCILDQMSGSYLGVLYELTNTELQFFSILNTLTVAALQPILDDPSLVGSCGSTVKNLFEAHIQISMNAAQNAHHLRYVIQHPNKNGALPLFHNVENQLMLYKKYCHHFCDVLALDGFGVCVRKSNEVFRCATPVLKDLGCDQTAKGTVSSEALQHLMEEPIRRMSQYNKIFENLAHQHKKRNWPCVCEEDVSAKWAKLVASVSACKADAEKTRAFWDSCPQKIVDSIRQPGRRVLRDSKFYPVGLLNAGRFSNHWFILFNDAFAHCQHSVVTVHDISLLWVDSATYIDGDKSSFKLTMPEESLALFCETALEKSEWVASLNDAINWKLRLTKDSLLQSDRSSQLILGSGRPPVSANRRFPPLRRSANYVFSKSASYKDACYSGLWLCGQMHGQGELTWPDNRKYVGGFKQNAKDGHGTYTVGAGTEVTTYGGRWKNGLMNGLGSIRYPNGDSYEGFFKDGLRHGHGVLKHGSFVSTGSVYVGQWDSDKRDGYGVMDSVDLGEKYMGKWLANERHGSGIVVTLDSVYYEGNFVHGQVGGLGLMYDEGNWYQGEVGSGGSFGGKGLLTLASGDVIDGTFAGSWNAGIKVNGTLTKAPSRKSSSDIAYPTAYAKFCVSANQKWKDIFHHCYEMLNITGCAGDTQKAWEAIAVFVTQWKKHLKPSAKGKEKAHEDIGILERIPPQNCGELTTESYHQICAYLHKAFDTPCHPLGRLMIGLVDVYRATYVGIGAHPCLLHHAVDEVHSFIHRIYNVVRILFPSLPAEEGEISSKEKCDRAPGPSGEQEQVVTAQSLLLPILLPKIYPPLFTLYAIHCEEEDNLYWETLLKWNKQPDLSLMAFLGVDEKFWLLVDDVNYLLNKRASMSTIRDAHYQCAINTLQQMSTTFSPLEKLQIIQKVFEEINVEVMRGISGHMWTMDDLFPVFQYVVIRAAIRHLGSEIRMVDDLMEKRLQNGELGIMFTMLKACYFQVKNEKSLSM